MSKIDEEKLVVGAYQKIASQFNSTRKFRWSWIESFLENIGDGKYVDIGCGGGRNLNENSIGVDNCQEFIDIVKSKGLNAIKADMSQLPFEDSTFDAILSIASFHHLATVERRIQSLQEMKRILKPNGKILLSVWSKEQPKKTRRKFENYGDVIVTWRRPQGDECIERYYYIFQWDEIVDLFNQVGFKIESCRWDCGNEVFILTH